MELLDTTKALLAHENLLKILQGDRETFTFAFMYLFNLKHPRGPAGLIKSPSKGRFVGLLNKSWEFWGLV